MAKPSAREVAHDDDRDFISELPGNVVDIILQFLPIRDAVRTSMLSRSWRYKWTTIPSLVFDDQFISCMEKWMIRLDLKDPKLQAYEFVTVITKLLSCHSGQILEFSLDAFDFAIGTISDTINLWIFLLSRKGIKKLSISNTNFGTNNYYDLNSHIFSCLELTDLNLSGFRFNHPPPTFAGFANLTSLRISDSGRHAKGLNLNCPLLRSLTLMSCTGISHLNFQAPNLKCLTVVGTPPSFNRLENLETFFFYLEKPSENMMPPNVYNVVNVLRCLPRLESFYVMGFAIQYLATGAVPYRHPAPLYYLKTLSIDGVNFAQLSEVSCLLCLIRSAPNLCKVDIRGYTDLENEADDAEDFRIQDSEKCTLSHLKTVTLENLNGYRAEMELIKYVLARSPVLETIFIRRSDEVKIETALMMTEEVLQFPRASVKAVIKTLLQSLQALQLIVQMMDTSYIYILNTVFVV